MTKKEREIELYVQGLVEAKGQTDSESFDRIIRDLENTRNDGYYTPEETVYILKEVEYRIALVGGIRRLAHEINSLKKRLQIDDIETILGELKRDLIKEPVEQSEGLRMSKLTAVFLTQALNKHRREQGLEDF